MRNRNKFYTEGALRQALKANGEGYSLFTVLEKLGYVNIKTSDATIYFDQGTNLTDVTPTNKGILHSISIEDWSKESKWPELKTVYDQTVMDDIVQYSA